MVLADFSFSKSKKILKILKARFHNDMANAIEGDSRAADIIKNWIRIRYTLEFLGIWEQIKNPGRFAQFCVECHRMD